MEMASVSGKRRKNPQHIESIVSDIHDHFYNVRNNLCWTTMNLVYPCMDNKKLDRKLVITHDVFIADRRADSD